MGSNQVVLAESEIELSVSQFVAVFNQTLEMAYPSVTIVGELANLRVSRNRWIYFDLKDETSSVKFFGTVYNLPGPLEDGLILKVKGQPRLHNLYGFSVNVSVISPAGEGSIRRAADLLKLKLEKEGLFDVSRKRPLPYPPNSIGLITSKASAAYADFIKVLSARWQGVEIELIDVQVQGEVAPMQLSAAIEQFNSLSSPPDMLVMIRGGGSAEDLAAFNTETVTRAVAASRVPTLVAIGHEIDISLAELAADGRASTPSNAAELMVPDKRETLQLLRSTRSTVSQIMLRHLQTVRADLKQKTQQISQSLDHELKTAKNKTEAMRRLLIAMSPESILKRGYALVLKDDNSVRSVSSLVAGDIVNVRLFDGDFTADVTGIIPKHGGNSGSK